MDLAKVPVSIEAIELVPEAQARAAKAAAIEIKVRDVALAAADPTSPAVQSIIQELQSRGFKIKLFRASESGLEQAWSFYKYVAQKGKEITGKVEIEKQHFEDLLGRLTTFQAVQSEVGKVKTGELNTTLLLEALLAGALNNRASDIHLEAGEEGARIRYRVDGILHDVYNDFPLHNYQSLINRIKLLSGLKINVRSEAQDGRFTINLPQKEVEMRVSIIPSEYGETVVMRILDPDSIRVELPQLGLRPDDLKLVEGELARPNGLILNTGPTGSGKTTTLYAFLRKLQSPEIKVITIEDPIEYRLEGVEQTQVDPEAGYTFANGLRAILRQDPDAVLVGEIRDQETADIAMQASLTGHLVLSTLHTNDAVGAVPRLTDLGVKPQTIGPALSLVIAQRLVRVLCPKCKKETVLDAALKDKVRKFLSSLPPRVDQKPYAEFKIYEPVGCPACNGFGYRGRVGIFEFLQAGPEMEELILKEVSEVSLKELAKKQQMVDMQSDGVLKVLVGKTSFAEVEKAAGKIEWK